MSQFQPSSVPIKIFEKGFWFKHRKSGIEPDEKNSDVFDPSP